MLVRGDREANEAKVKSYLEAELAELASAEEVMQATGAPVGFAGPVGLTLKGGRFRSSAAMAEGSPVQPGDTHLKESAQDMIFAGTHRRFPECNGR